jgi:hypothetical protein
MTEGLSLGSYLLLVDDTGRVFHQGKATISREMAGPFDRLGTTAETWRARRKELSRGRLLGRFPPLLRRICDFGESACG